MAQIAPGTGGGGTRAQRIGSTQTNTTQAATTIGPNATALKNGRGTVFASSSPTGQSTIVSQAGAISAAFDVANHRVAAQAAKVFNTPRAAYIQRLSPDLNGHPGTGIMTAAFFNALQYTDANGKSQTAAPGTIAAPANYGFYFDYNPNDIQQAFAVDYGTSAKPPADVSINLTASYGVSTFSTIINRQLEVVNKTPIGQKSSFSNIRDFSQIGTLYDLEFFFRTINGAPSKLLNTVYASSNFGYLLGTTVKLAFGVASGLQLYGIVTSATVDHQLFSADMIPTVSMLTLSFTSVSSVAPDSTEMQSGGGTASPSADKTAKATRTSHGGLYNVVNTLVHQSPAPNYITGGTIK